ncbi:hypothetical protein QWJ41_02795 [Nocardioides sp. SOB44]|jgi:hypothetical protein|uniref:Uncharacterized protein n=1 Tax=Nocardioides cremeus TaxID=3058044 RepID=A0ABT8TNU2_9ACTN|nr:hypothetical protein [Nocardioides cremeus]MDO3394638.1 hypothetical protein [Nocardioides cremeus]
MRRTATFTAGVVLAATAGTGLAAWAVPALAQDTESQGSQVAGQGADDDNDTEDAEDRRAEMQAALADALAAELGLDADEVAAALEKVQTDLRAEMQTEHLERLEERLAEAVEAGELTQEEADEVLGRAESGELRGPGRRGGHGGHGGPGGPGGPGGWAEDSATSL